MSEHDRLRLAVIIGSTRKGRFGPTIARWFVGRARRHSDLDIDVIDLAEADLPSSLTDEDEPVPPQVLALAPRLSAADAFAVVTPEYNRSFPAPLKTAIDWYYTEWQAKPVTFVAYGGESGGLHVIDQLRQIFTELNAVAIRDAISLPRYWEMFAPDGTWPKAASDCNTTITATAGPPVLVGLRVARRPNQVPLHHIGRLPQRATPTMRASSPLPTGQ